MAIFTTLPSPNDLLNTTNSYLTTSLTSTLSGNSSKYNDTNVTTGCRLVTTKFAYIPWDNPDNIISAKTAVLLHKMFLGTFTALFGLIGMPLNIVNGIVFYRQGLKDRITLLLFCLAVSDFLVEVYMFVHSLEYCYSMLAGNFQPYGPFSTRLLNHGMNTMYGFTHASGFISTVIACERCLCITRPFTAKKFLKSTTAGIIVVVATLVLVGFHYMIGEKFKIGCVHYVQLGLTVKGYIPGPLYLRYPRLLEVLSGAMYGLFLPVFFSTLTAITTVVTAVKLKTAAEWRQQMTSAVDSSKKEVALTKMLIAVSILFVVCTIPNIVVRILPVIVPDFQLGGRYQNLYASGVRLMLVTPALNSCVNFFFYFHMGSKFRLTLKVLCSRSARESAE